MNRKLAVVLMTLALAAWAVAQTGQSEQITSGPAVEGVTANSATIAWSTNAGGSSIVRYGTDPNNLNQTAQSPYAHTGSAHRVQLKNLQPGVTYYYQVISGQGQGTGTMAIGQVSQFTTPGQGAQASSTQSEQITSAPTVEAITGNSAIIAWGTNTGGSSVVRYGTDPNNLNQTAQSAYVQGGGTHRVTLKNLQPGTTYYFQVVSGQGQGTGTTATGQIGQFTTPGGPGAMGEANATRLPLYRATNANGSHLFTTDYSQLQSAQAQGFKREGIAGYVDKSQGPGDAPLFHLVGANGDNFYTTSDSERANAMSQLGYRDAGIVGYVSSSPQQGTVPLYRLYNAGTKEHFYTTDASERSSLISQGWKEETAVGYIWAH